jgi:hypothetical protein
MMEFWIKLWTWVLAINLLVFAALAITVTIGGLGNILSMLRSLRAQNDEQARTGQQEPLHE